MDRRQFVLTAFGVSLAALGLEGCGGGGGKAGGGTSLTGAPPQSVSGRFVAPSGFTAPLNTLQVSSAYGDSPVAADGSFAISAPGGQTSLVWLVNAAGKIMMFGFAHASGGAVTVDITPKTTAVALLFWGTGAFTANDDNFDNIISLLTQTPQADQLGAVVATQITANNTAIDDGDSQIASATQAGAAAIVGPNAAAATKSAPSVARAATVAVSRAPAGSTRATGTLVTITTGGPSSGVEVQENLAGDGIVVVNHFRRWCKFYVYETGTADANGNITNLAAPRQLGGEYDMMSTGKLDLVASLGAVILGTSSWVPVPSDPVSLPLDAGSKKTFYDVIVVGPSLVPGSNILSSDAKYASQTDTWSKALEFLWLKTAIVDFVYPILKFFLGVKGEITAGAADALVTAIIGGPASAVFNSANVVKGLPIMLRLAMANFAREGQLNAQNRIISTAVMKPFLPYIYPAPALGKAVGKLDSAARVFGVFLIIDALLAAGDLYAVIKDLNNAAAIDYFQANVFVPSVTVTPATSELRPGASELFTASLPVGVDTSGLKLTYHWSTTGGNGELSDRSGKTGASFDTDQAIVQLTIIPIAGNGQKQQVTVDIKNTAGGANIDYGTGAATVTVNTNPTQVLAGRFDVVVQRSSDGTRSSQTAAVFFPKVPNAKSYQIHCYGFSDPAYWAQFGNVIDQSYGADPTATGAQVQGSEYWFGIAGGTGPVSSEAAGIAYYKARFAGMLVKVTVTF